MEVAVTEGSGTARGVLRMRGKAVLWEGGGALSSAGAAG